MTHGIIDASPSRARRFAAAIFCVVLAVAVLRPGEVQVQASGPYGATYCSDNNHVFWFIHMSDPHIGSGSTAVNRLTWIVTTGRSVIGPSFIVATGDLTDSTNGNFAGYPNGPHQAEWDSYKGILAAAGLTLDDYYDIPGNHDAYNDRYFAYYKANGFQRLAFGNSGQVAWTKTTGWGDTYHFVAVNTADNTGAGFSIFPPYGDHAGLDATELTALENDLASPAAAGAKLSFVFGHHPVTGTGSSSDTYLYYGASQFVSDLHAYGASAYNYGHVHDNVETIFTGNSYTGSIPPGVRYTRVASLGKSDGNNYSVVSVDCNGTNWVTQPVGTWPLVMITAPVNKYAGTATNPYGYDVPAVATNPIRALVFDGGTVGTVQFRIDGGAWFPMIRTAAGSPQWTGTWDASGLSAGEHSVEVQAQGSTPRSHVIKVNVTAATVNRPPVAVADSYTTPQGTALTIAAPGVLANDSDPDGNPLAATLVSGPANGTLALGANGGFTYTPTAGFSGTDAFTYKASDGSATSQATATITVNPAPSTDTVTITSAVYTRRTTTLAVKATSSAAGTARLTLVGYGLMTYSAKTRTYTYQAKVSPAPQTVAVTSDKGGSATSAVNVK